MADLGISVDTTVVAYDDGDGAFAARLWWVLTYYGHADVKVLNGGWQRWLRAGWPISRRDATPIAGRFTPRPNEAMRIRLDELKARCADPELQIVDVRPRDGFRGVDNPFGNRRLGHIPGSANVPIERFIVDDAIPMLKPAAALQTELRRAGLRPEMETAVHCQSGVRTALAIFVLLLLGWERVRAYEASLAEWANRADTPLVTGEDDAAAVSRPTE
jgi:thiosulfate/3-mercaptopyruvate sulfurtransferase